MPEQTGQPAHKQFNDPVSVAKRTKQKVYLAAQRDKAAMLEQIIKSADVTQAVVITKTKRGADALSAHLESEGIKAAVVHGNKSAKVCDAAVKAFNEGEVSILITTDMILLSLNLDTIPCIIGYDLPIQPEHYFSRLGCMNEAGEAISLVTPDEQGLLYTIERSMKQEIEVKELEGFVASPGGDEVAEAGKKRTKKPRHRKQRRKKESPSEEK